jgi:hypothetical protein
MIGLIPFPFEDWAAREGYNIAPAVVPADIRTYADRHTQAAFEAWNAGARSVARMITESTLEIEAVREKILTLAES